MDLAQLLVDSYGIGGTVSRVEVILGYGGLMSLTSTAIFVGSVVTLRGLGRWCPLGGSGVVGVRLPGIGGALDWFTPRSPPLDYFLRPPSLAPLSYQAIHVH